MMHYKLVPLLFILNFSFSLVFSQSPLIDQSATKETVSAYRSLMRLSQQGVLFGHQDDMTKGVGWKNTANKSDIKDLVGEHPSIYGWDLGLIERGSSVNVSKIPFTKLSAFVKLAYEQGGINTFSWHCDNPVYSGQGVKSSGKTIKQLFENDEALSRYKAWLNNLAAYFKSLKGPNGELIPILFRPFHENTGSWFWWGKGKCTPQEYIKLWRFTVDYLKNTQQVHNLIYVYSTDGFNSQDVYLSRYPGDDYVDVLGFDYYDRKQNYPQNAFVSKVKVMANIVTSLAKEKNKISAFTETGFKDMPVSSWWSQTLLPAIKDSGLAYVLIWGNYDAKSFWGTFPGQASSTDFKNFYQSNRILFEKRVSREKVYKN